MLSEEEFKLELQQRGIQLMDGTQQPPGAAGEMRGLTQIGDTVERFVPVIEKITGLTRRDITLQLLKAGVKGNMGGLLEGLMGKTPEKPAKFERYVKIAAIWVPVAVLLFGMVIIALVFAFKLVMAVLA